MSASQPAKEGGGGGRCDVCVKIKTIYSGDIGGFLHPLAVYTGGGLHASAVAPTPNVCQVWANTNTIVVGVGGRLHVHTHTYATHI